MNSKKPPTNTPIMLCHCPEERNLFYIVIKEFLLIMLVSLF